MKNLILVILIGIVPLQFMGQTQLTIDPVSTIQQLNLNSVVKKSLNDYYACGILPNGSDFGMVTRFTSNQILWDNYFETTYVPTMTVASNGDAIVGGENLGKGFVARIDQDGNLIWNTNISAGGESFTHIVETPSGDIYGTGRTIGNSEFLVKLSSLGIILWEKKPISFTDAADYPKILLAGDSILIVDGTSGGSVVLRILNSNGGELLHRTYGVTGIGEPITSFIKIPTGYAIATIRGSEIGIIKLDRNFNIVGSRVYGSSIGGPLIEGKLMYDSACLYLSGARRQNNNVETPRAFVAKLDTSTLGVLWNRVLSSANSLPACEPFMDGTLRVAYMRWPSINGSARGVVLASIDPATGNLTGTSCESTSQFTLVAGPYTGLVQNDVGLSTWTDLTLVPESPSSYGYYPLILDDCEPGILAERLLHIKAFLGGAYDETTGLMWDSLRVRGLLPITDPYVHGPGGTSVSPAVFDVEGPNAIVDWVKIKIRDPITPHTVLDSILAFVQRDGDVVALDGVSLPITSLTGGSYYISLHHRSHLGVCTATAVPTSSVVDFRSAATATYGSEAEKIVGGVMVMWEGDVQFNGDVKYVGADNDRDNILSVIGGGSVPTDISYGIYNNADVNMDGDVIYVGAGNDRDRVLVVIGGTIPTNVRVQQMP